MPVLDMLITIAVDLTSGPDGASAQVRKFGDYVSILSNGAARQEVAGRYDTPVTGWANLDGSGFNRGVFNSDEISAGGFAMIASYSTSSTTGCWGPGMCCGC